MQNVRSKHANVPTITNLVAAGDPSKKAKAKTTKNKSNSSHLDDLNQRIDEIENAIGQNDSGPVGRAFAIRKETNKTTKSKPSFMSNRDLEKIK